MNRSAQTDKNIQALTNLSGTRVSHGTQVFSIHLLINVVI
ncbi:hypothetical protein EH2_04184 [Bacillus subtilis]|nr:hypothetical protein EH5_04208 [Bacillus subtilis]RPK13310.1 hypothetical protein EH2_04184 [Bacillus subtilis]CCU56679.1 hypothetical protein BSUBE1_0048 [Bacillus subtilis E1]